MTIGAAAMNVAQTVNTQSSTEQAATSSDTDFKSIMKTSMAAGAKNTVSGSRSNTDSQINLKKTSVNDASKENKTSNTQNTNTQKTSDKVSDKADNSNLKEKVTDAVNDVKDKIKEELNVTDEDIANAMETLGIAFMDLLQPEKLTQLVTQLTGSDDNLLFVTDADMFNKLNSILDVASQGIQMISEELNVDSSDALNVIDTAKDVLSTMEDKAQTDDTVKTAVQQSGVDYVTDDDTAKEVQPDTKEDALTTVIKEKLTVNVTENSGTDNSKNNMSDKKDNSTDMFNYVADNLSQGIKETFDNLAVDNESFINELDIARQVIDTVKVTAGQQLSSIEVMLNPENLGSVHVTVTAKDGIVTAQLTAQNEQVKHALENQIVNLKENFENQGIKVDAVEVTIQSHSFEAAYDGNQAKDNKQETHNNRHKIDISALFEDDDDLSDEEIRRNNLMNNENSSVEYSA